MGISQEDWDKLKGACIKLVTEAQLEGIPHEYIYAAVLKKYSDNTRLATEINILIAQLFVNYEIELLIWKNTDFNLLGGRNEISSISIQ